MNRKDIISLWVREHGDYLFNYTVSKVPDEESARDILQETFIAAYTNYVGFKENSTPRTWLLSILRHKISDYYRSEFKEANMINAHYHLHGVFDNMGGWQRGQEPNHLLLQDDILDDDEFLYVLHDCISVLPSKLKKAVLLKYFNNQSGHKICQDLDITPTNFWQILHRAKIRLRTCLEHKWFKTQKQ